MITYEQYLKLVSKYLSNKGSTTAEEKGQIGDFEIRQPMGCPHCNRAIWTPYEGQELPTTSNRAAKTQNFEPLPNSKFESSYFFEEKNS
jgi:hypothetical protein